MVIILRFRGFRKSLGMPDLSISDAFRPADRRKDRAA
jgi:hypothetical protein